MRDYTLPGPISTEAELRRLRRRLTLLTAEAAKNENILRRAQRRELELLQSASLEDLLERLVGGLAASFGLDSVTLALRDPEHEVRHLLMGAGGDPQRTRGVLFVDSLGDLWPGLSTLKKPFLGPYVARDHAALFATSAPLRSIALLPLNRQNRLMGTLNFGSSDLSRFTAEHATDFLGHLVTIAAFCLENAVNRSRLELSGVTDPLTGWRNRRYLDSRMREELARAVRDGTPLACLLLDIDHFKRINDSHGHLAGDSVLREVADRVGSKVRSSDVAARYGGEEFILLLPATRSDSACRLAERIRSSVSATPIRVDDENAVTVTVSIGVATLEDTGLQADLDVQANTLLDNADRALYQAKGQGRDQVQAFTPDSSD